MECLQGMEKEMKKQFRDFESAREFVRKLGLKNREEWKEYCKSGNKPDDIRSYPNDCYKNEFKGYGDWIGTDRISTIKLNFLSFESAREFVRKLGLKSKTEWKEYCKSSKSQDNIPTNPERTYKNEFKGMGDWLGNGNTRDWRSFESAREFVRSLGIKNHKEWKEYCKSGNKPDDIPSNPWDVYEGWNIKRREKRNKKV
jgi:hypothetical protein